MVGLNLNKKIFISLCIGLCLLACSRLDWAISLAPRILSAKIDEAFDFPSQKNRQIRSSIETILDDQKKEAGQKLAQIISILESEAQAGLNSKNIILVFDELAIWQRSFLQKFLPTIHWVVDQLSQAELDHYQSFHQKKFKDALDEISTDDDLDKQIYDKYENFFEFFIDEVRHDQKLAIREFIRNHRNYYRQQVNRRREFTEKFFRFAQEKKPDQQSLSDLVLEQFSVPNFDTVSPAEKKVFVEQSIELCAKIWSLTTEVQKKYFFKQLEFYRKILLDLSPK